VVDTPRIACLGELLWDVFPDGQRLGGAPANVAFHAARLGAEASLVSRVGSDGLGDLALVELARAGVNTDAIERDAELPTGTVLVSLVHGEPHYTIVAPAAWDRITGPPPWLAAHPGSLAPHALVLGSLAARRTEQAARLRSWLGDTRAKAAERPKVVLDLNLRRPHLPLDFIKDALALTDLLKLNEDELAWLGSAGMDLVPPVTTENERECIDRLFERFELEFIVVTRGERGAALFSREHSLEAPGIPITLGDAVGAGDAFLAALVVTLLTGGDLPTCLDQANRRAAAVAAARGAMSAS